MQNIHVKILHQQYRNKREEKSPQVLQIMLIVLILCWIWMVGQYVMTPKEIYISKAEISKAEANTGGEIEFPVKAGVVEIPASQTNREVINTSQAGVKSQESSSSQVGLEEIKEKIKAAFPDNYRIMIAIGMGESRLDNSIPPNVNRNGSTDTGIFRVNSVHGYSQEYLSDVDNNIAVAKKIYHLGGYDQWVAYWSGSYKAFLN